ncbi:hypothetical protein IEQ34_009849 [Dendrobium chrysotoxum]|uniref:Response regulatory domain-containing protein n=1 Tax=Dendrobium chrysotoxum TaxID=161865 RepID=A0AAV7H3G7_DENCH|nr:hypothetical protein IEQ34_009849 [Dendrobium chrysotoxum]
MLPDGFPAGLRVFVVEEDSVVLRMLEKMLLQCGYKGSVSSQQVVCNVTIPDCPLQAFELLSANIGNYDIVLIDVNLTCIDGFQLLEIVSREINLPVIVLSLYSDFENVMKSIKYGAVDYLVKPVRLEELKLIWKHVVKNSLNEKKSINESRSMDVNFSNLTKKSKDLVRKRDEDDDIALKDNLVSQKRARVSWTPELHAKFINAVNQLGIDNAVPIKILDIMDIPGLTRENVASHLQLDCQAQSYENSRTSNGHNELNPIPQLESTIEHDAIDMSLNNDLNDNNNFDELATLLALEQKQQQNSSDSGAQINTDSVDVQSYSLEDHGGSNASNLAILSEFDNMDDTDELYVALCQENLDSFPVLSFVDCCSLHLSPDHAIMSSNQNGQI